MTDEKTTEKTLAEQQAALPAGFRIEPKKTVVLLKPTIVDNEEKAVGDSVELDANVANILIGDGTAQSEEDAAKAKEAAASEGESESGGTRHHRRR